MAERNCNMCRWLYVHDGDNPDYTQTSRCAYNPPQVFAAHDGKGWHTITLYPLVDQLEDFCANWEMTIED